MESMVYDLNTILLSITIVTLSFVLSFLSWRKTWTKVGNRTQSFQFLKLPAELRELVYEHLVDVEPSYPLVHKESSNLNWLTARYKSRPHKLGIMLANRQVYEEVIQVLSKRTTFKLSVDHSKQPELQESVIPKDLAPLVRNCEVRVVTTSHLLGGEDPRSLPTAVPFCKRVVECFKDMSNVKRLDLNVEAIGDPLWNPLWVWYHASKAFRRVENVPINSIAFSVDSWSPGENHLVRTGSGQSAEWHWACSKKHFLASDCSREQTIREFCSFLFAECPTCESITHPDAARTPSPEAAS